MAAGTHSSEILNFAMALALEFGPDWRSPITDRLLARHPELAREQAEDVDRHIRLSRDAAHRMIAAHTDGEISEGEARRQIHDANPWMDPVTLEDVWNQGLYYAMKR